MEVNLVPFWSRLDRLVTELNLQSRRLLECRIEVVTVLNMSRRTIVACTAVVLLTAIGSGSVSADESVPPTTTTVVEQFDEESGLIYSQVDDHTIEVSLPD